MKIVDFRNSELVIGDLVAFGSFGGALEKAVVVGAETIGRSQLVVLVNTRGDGSNLTLKLHSSCIVKL